MPGRGGRIVRDLMPFLFRHVMTDRSLVWMVDHRVEWDRPTDGSSDGLTSDQVDPGHQRQCVRGASHATSSIRSMRIARLTDADRRYLERVAEDCRRFAWSGRGRWHPARQHCRDPHPLALPTGPDRLDERGPRRAADRAHADFRSTSCWTDPAALSALYRSLRSRRPASSTERQRHRLARRGRAVRLDHLDRLPAVLAGHDRLATLVDRPGEVLDLRGEALQPVRVEVVAQEVERHLLRDDIPCRVLAEADGAVVVGFEPPPARRASSSSSSTRPLWIRGGSVPSVEKARLHSVLPIGFRTACRSSRSPTRPTSWCWRTSGERSTASRAWSSPAARRFTARSSSRAALRPRSACRPRASAALDRRAEHVVSVVSQPVAPAARAGPWRRARAPSARERRGLARDSRACHAGSAGGAARAGRS